MKKDSGFTLVEMMIVVAIAGVVLSIGIPKLSVFFQGSRMITNTNELVSALQIAKSEAIKRQGYVTVCRSTDQTTCALDGANTWEDGFIVFYDQNGDQVKDSGTDIMLKINAGAEGSDTTIRSSTTTNNEDDFIRFSSRGHPKNGTTLQSTIFVLCDDRDNLTAGINSVTVNGVAKTAARGVILSMSGKVRATKDASVLTSCLNI